ncbi:MAG: cofactor-independent phosphoglycerate mutase [Planctomycetota bacterium]|nr:cofactor-independent phosphoglycerate mutase [Planctomycetota bacterium]
MKYVLVLPDGAADEPLAELEGRTPLEAARLPHMDWIAARGRQGRVVTVPQGFTPGTDVATLSLFGYDPKRFYTGRAPIEAAARNLQASEEQLIFRCNFVTIRDGRMTDFTADHISQNEADQLIDDLNALFRDDPCEFHAGVSYRNLMLASNAAQMKLTCQPPHDIPGEPVAEYQPRGVGAGRITAIMDRAAAMLADHPVNARRVASGKRPATHIWLWGQGRPTVLDSFAQRFGVRGAVITGVDIIRGLAVCMDMTLIEVEGATGYLDTNYAGKGQAAVAALDQYDLVVVHVEAPDEAGHEGDPRKKIEALERTDELIVGPLLEAVRRREAWRVMVAPDHPTPCTTRAHSSVPPPFCCAGRGIETAGGRPFSERHAQATGDLVDPGQELMAQFMSR